MINPTLCCLSFHIKAT